MNDESKTFSLAIFLFSFAGSTIFDGMLFSSTGCTDIKSGFCGEDCEVRKFTAGNFEFGVFEDFSFEEFWFDGCADISSGVDHGNTRGVEVCKEHFSFEPWFNKHLNSRLKISKCTLWTSLRWFWSLANKISVFWLNQMYVYFQKFWIKTSLRCFITSWYGTSFTFSLPYGSKLLGIDFKFSGFTPVPNPLSQIKHRCRGLCWRNNCL